jgi:flagellar motor switch/type III secretory pathway protein FliN
MPDALPAPATAPATALPAEAAPSSVTVLLTARVASLSVPLSRLTDLTAGSTLLLGVPADQPVELLSGGRDGPVVAEAQIGRKGNKMALRISRRVPGFR